jgi:hypothetical protein
MSTRKKKKKPQISHSNYVDFSITKTYFDHYSEIARKIMHLMELDAALYDKLTKKEKHTLMRLRHSPLKISAEKGHLIPKAHIKFLHEQMYLLMRDATIGDKSLGLTLFDYTTYGMAFLSILLAKASKYEDSDPSPMSVITKRAAEFLNEEQHKDLLDALYNLISMNLTFISRINFRVYSFLFEWSILGEIGPLVGCVKVTSAMPEMKRFIYQNKERTAFRMATGNMFSEEPILFSIPFQRVFPHSKRTDSLKVYIQNHAVHRIKERLDVYPNNDTNLIIRHMVASFETIKNHHNQLLIVCREYGHRIIGYSPFTIVGDSLYVLSLLPMCSDEVPEGKMLNELLGTTKEDHRFLGMDKLSFFVNTDFDTLPEVAEAMKKANLWGLNELCIEDEKQYVKPSPIVRKFFQAKQIGEEEVIAE